MENTARVIFKVMIIIDNIIRVASLLSLGQHYENEEFDVTFSSLRAVPMHAVFIDI